MGKGIYSFFKKRKKRFFVWEEKKTELLVFKTRCSTSSGRFSTHLLLAFQYTCCRCRTQQPVIPMASKTTNPTQKTIKTVGLERVLLLFNIKTACCVLLVPSVAPTLPSLSLVVSIPAVPTLEVMQNSLFIYDVRVVFKAKWISQIATTFVTYRYLLQYDRSE